MTFLTGLKIINDELPCHGNEEGGLDECPFIWKNFHDHGYITAYAEDVTSMSTFNFLKKGFKDQPTDHYFRPYFLSIMDKLDVHMVGCCSPFCISYKHGAEYVFDYMMDFVRRYKGSPYFGLFWANSFSHDDPNLAFIMDTKILKYLEQLEVEGFNEEAVIIFLSDHGLRFGGARQTPAGAFEESLPMLNIWIPSKLRNEDVLKNLRENQNRLINPYDLYQTMLDILKRSGYKINTLNKDACPNCTSILEPISPERTCRDVGIPSEYCACKDYKSISTNSKLAVTTANNIVDYLNDFKNTFQNGSFHELCKDLHLGIISDVHETVEDSKNVEKNLVLSFETEPNKGLFEVTVKYPQNVTIPAITKDSIHISRINLYEKDSHCIKEAELLKFCYCGD